MRVILLPVLLSLITTLVVSCGNNSAGDETSRLQSERDSLLLLANENQRELERMTTFFDEVAACIDSISEQEKLLVAQVDIETNKRYSKSEMAQRLNQLSEIITGQRRRIASLVDSLNNQVDTARINGLRSTIAYLTQQLDIKETQIQRLKAEINGHKRDIRSLTAKVEDLNNEVIDLTSRNGALVEAVQVQSNIINEGYVLVASKQQLKQMGIIEGGGFLRSSKVNLGKVNPSQCNKVDIAALKEIPINSKKVKLLSPAPPSSYTIRNNGQSSTFVINDANAFWSLSNILVIQTQ